MESNNYGLVLLGAAIHEQVDRHYIDLPYHNHRHADQVTLEAMNLAQYCEDNGLVVDRLALLTAAQYHDAGYYEELDVSRFSSKEKYATYLAVQELPQLGIPDWVIENSAHCINATERGVNCESLEAKILRRADLANLAGPIGSMVLSSLNLYREITHEEGLQKGSIEFLRNARANIADYLSEDVSFGDFDRKHDKSLWLLGAEQNLKLVDAIVAQPWEQASKLLNDHLGRAA